MPVQHYARTVRPRHAPPPPDGTDRVEGARPGDTDDADRAARAGADGRDRVILMLKQDGKLQKNEKNKGAGLEFPAFRW